MRGPMLLILRALALVILGAGAAVAQNVPVYTGSAACTGCHQEAAAAWAVSDHAHAWMAPGPDTILGDFSDVTYEHGGYATRFFTRDGTYFIETEGADGVRQAFPVVGVAGIAPLQQYLLEPVPGRTQAYDIAWDVDLGQWYPVFEGAAPPPGDGFHWTGPYKSWETRCAECHATGYTRNYEVETRTFAPRMAETGVGCEACHGPGSAHVAWAQAAGALNPMSEGLSPVGLTAALGSSQWAEVQQCMTCHSVREALADGNPLPGSSYHDAFTLALLRQGQYFADGQQLGEVYEGGSFLQSKMFASGVRCSDCHEPHSGALRAEGNGVCTQCHSEAGNPRFENLPLRVFDGPEHTHHAEGSPGAQCVSCHMTERTYMGIDERGDHSFRIPRPDLAAETGAPDACTTCHADKTPEWAAEAIAGWFPDSTHRGPHFGTLFMAARLDPVTSADDLLALAQGPGAGIVRATALDLLGPALRPDQADGVAALIADPDPLVRAAAVHAMAAFPDDPRVFAALSDEVRSVRVEAAQTVLTATPPAEGSPEAAAVATAMAEWQAGIMSRIDFPETYMQLGGIGLTTRNWDMALQSFQEAVSLDPQLVSAWSVLVRLQAAMGDRQVAQQTFLQAFQLNPMNEELMSLAPEVGLGIVPPGGGSE